MTEYITTNVRLPKEIYRRAKRRALEEEKSLAALIRESIVEYLTEGRSIPAEGEGSATRLADDPLWLIGTDPIVADVTDASDNHDLYLYGPLRDAARGEIKG